MHPRNKVPKTCKKNCLSMKISPKNVNESTALGLPAHQYKHQYCTNPKMSPRPLQ